MNRVPTNRVKFYGKLPLKLAIERAEAEGRATLGGLTQQQYFDTFRDMLDLAAKKRLIPVNFAEGMKPVKRDEVARQDKRDPFELEQIVQFFKSEFYRSCASSGPRPYRHDDKGGWRFWLPPICLFMGLRPNEVCQLDASDVRTSAKGVWFIEVTDRSDTDDENAAKAPRKTIKTSGSRRRVPVPETLVALGFIAFAGEARKRGGRLFPTLKPDHYGNFATYALKRFRDAFLPAAVTVRERQSFYSFRHSFRDALRRAKADHDTLHALGWSQGSFVSDDYGQKSDVDGLAAFMNTISFPGLDLSSLYVRPAKMRS